MAASILGLITLYVIWGSTFLAIRFGLDGLPPMLLAGSRFVVAGGALLAIWGLFGSPAGGSRWLVPRGSLKRTLVLSVLMFPVANGLVVWAEVTATSATVALLWATYPMWLAVLVFVLLRKAPRRTVVIGMILGMAGLAMGLAPVGAAAVPSGAFWSVTVAVIAWGLATLYAQRHPGTVPLLLDSSWQMIIGGLVLLSVSLVLGEPFAFDAGRLTTGSLLGWSYLVVFGSAGFPLYLWLLNRFSASTVATYAYVCPAIAVVLGVVMRSEPFGPRLSFMAVLVLLGVVLTVGRWNGARAARPAPSGDSGVRRLNAARARRRASAAPITGANGRPMPRRADCA